MGKFIEVHFQIFPNNFPQEPFWNVFAAVNRHCGIPAIIGFHPDMRPFLADNGKTKCLKKSDEVLALNHRKHYAPWTISTSRNPTNVL